LARWTRGHVRERLAPLFRLTEAELPGPGRGHPLQLGEALGALPRAQVESLIPGLAKEQRAALARLGVRLGFSQVFLPALVKPRAVALRALLWNVRHGGRGTQVPPPGRVSVPVDPACHPPEFLEALGYARVGPRAVRVDILDRLEKLLMERGKQGPLRDTAELAQLLGAPPADMDGVLRALGYRPTEARGTGEGEGGVAWARVVRRRGAGKAKGRRPAAPRAPAADHPFAALSRLVRTP
jgi:ATP-dependent RNA helicase SUPV3L1/SUV3